MSLEYKLYRRLIFCKIRKGKDLEKFIKILKKDGWKRDLFGKRGASYSFTKSAEELGRYHLRIYRISNYYYVLIHQEPTVLGDFRFHVRGFADRIKTRFKSKKEYLSDDDKLELANYMKGNEYLDEFVKKNDKLRQICEFHLEENELKIFSMMFGIVSLKLPFELLIEDLGEVLDLEDNEEFYQVIKKLFEILEFKVIKANNSDFVIFESPSVKKFKFLIRRVKIKSIDINEIKKLKKEHEIDSILLIPGRQEQVPLDMIQVLEDQDIGIIYPTIFLKIFHIYTSAPISHEKFQKLFSKAGLIDSNFIDEVLQPLEISELSKKALDVFRFLKEQNDWIYLDLLVNEFIKSRKLQKKEGRLILDFLTHPLINLVIIKKEKHRFKRNKTLYRAIKNFDEIQYRLKMIKQLLNSFI
ncbi:MAG: hypothetical protein ACTSX4_00130 [Candidatus Helarchaeota archaeon]